MDDFRRIEWQCRRGMRELDLMLRAYLNRSYDLAPATEQRQFAELLELSDTQLQRLLLSADPIVDPGFDGLVAKIRRHLPL